MLPKQYQFPGFSNFIREISTELDRKMFKGELLKKESANEFKPVYMHEQCVEEYEQGTSKYSINITAYTGLFGVIFAIAVLYSIKNR